MFIHYPTYTQRIPNVSPGLVFLGAYIRKDIWVILQGAYILEGLIFGILRYCNIVFVVIFVNFDYS